MGYFETTTIANNDFIFVSVPVSFINSQYRVLRIDKNSRFIDSIDHGLYDGNAHSFLNYHSDKVV
ncbi:hypothetical protein GNIT_1327 [Glaciecola nitratireducens FR1064]|uniref:Uncharacterized protein n=1 Tax=Glaciecola nitratireducens (strain JCM 12485 / KCTC 12276 / FR1064) TaxID=1085623 RepID=G4QGC6_GLANF|nr:hypothetical protein GNIT_1327 [Glaciecola nitratireducens FR1064]